MRQQRIASVLLLLAMLIGCLPFNAFAAELGRKKDVRAGETATAYGITLEDMISSADLLSQARDYVDSHSIDSIYEGGKNDGISDHH